MGDDGDEVTPRAFASLSASDQAAAKNDVLECSRYDELENLRLLWKMVPDMDPNVTDEDGNTALHMASANNHGEVVKFLLVEKGATFGKNKAGNSPLHWALENKQEKAVAALLEHGKDIDVLDQNAQKKSSVTLAMDTNNATIVQAVLKHPSADKLGKNQSQDGEAGQEDVEDSESGALGGTASEAEVDGETEDGMCRVKTQTSQSLCVFGDQEVAVREIGLVDTSKTTDDLKTTGAFLWAASLALSRWIVDEKTLFQGKLVAELGAGCGLPGIVAYRCTEAREVVVTDVDSATYFNTEHNVGLHAGARENASLSACALDWTEESSWSETLKGKTDVLIGSDLVYDLDLVGPLVHTIKSLLCEKGEFLYVSADDDRAGLREFLAAMEAVGFTMERSPAPAAYLDDPFKEAPASYALRFPEIAATQFTLYRFKATA
ncbi:Ankyrin repeat protein, putative [Hondaea fermentalgiana]|uniref:Ankyrin repeat protein, putative n=1 Tax=Hondaea fermentalgiana TaxID=2315210 RepID=A0A2R5GW38_9STRA|nr:Ankyrin repeat protein, putative [Hondaea fermentalgiana]|eukprot:GBG35052.1 Ankyrin repeat protein, putative [Hondaea fermentalgiana]